MEDERDYAVCREAPDGKHVPEWGDSTHDPEMTEGYMVIICKLCGQTTGFPMPPLPALEEIDWG